MQLGFVLAIRGLPAGTGGDLIKEEEFRLRVVDLYFPGVLLHPETIRAPLLHQGLLAYLRSHAIMLGGDESIRSVKLLAAALHPSGAHEDLAVSVLNSFEERQVRLCRYDNAPVVPGWPSGLDRQQGQGGPDKATPPSAYGASSPRLDQPALQPGSPQDVRYTSGAHAAVPELSSALPPLASFGDPEMRTRGSAARTELIPGLCQEQKLRYFLNFLRGNSKRYYLSELEPHVTLYADAVKCIPSEYHSAVHQSQAQNTLGSLRMANLVAKGLYEKEALMETYRTVAKVSRLLPSSHQREAHRVHFLRIAVVGYSCSTAPLSRTPTAQLCFQQLYGELQSAFFLSEEARHAVIQNSAVSAQTTAISSETMDVLCSGLCWYANNPKGKGDRDGGNASIRFNPLSLMGSFNCYKPDLAAKN